MATVHGDDITIGGERSAVELLIRKISRKYGIKKQTIGEGADLDKSGRVLNRVIEWGRDGITIEADQRHVREILRGLELALRLHVLWKTIARAMQGMMKARERIHGDVDGHCPSTSGTT